MKLVDRELALRQLATMLRSGLPLMSALTASAEQAARRSHAAMWRRVADRIGAGGMLSSALAETRRFDRYVVALVRVGESTGELERTLLAAADYLARRREHRAMVLNALFYPIVVVLATVAVIWFMLAKVIPALGQFLEGQRQRLPEMTLLLMDMSDWVVENGLCLALWTGFVLAAFWLARRNDVVRETTDALAFRIPVFGGVARLSSTAVFARSLGLLLESGVTMLAGLETVEGLFANRMIRRRIAEARDNVIRGGTLSEAFRSNREFEPMLARMMSVGEMSGTLGTVLAEAAEFHEARLRMAIRRFGMIMEPLLIVVVGGIVGFVYIAFFLAIFSLAGGV